MSKKPEQKTGSRAGRAAPSQRTSPWVIGGIVVIAVLVVAVMVQSARANTSPAPSFASQSDAPTGLSDTGYYYRGSPDAKVVVVAYEDLRCPRCRDHFVDVEPQVFDQYVKTGLVREESRLVAYLGPASEAAAEATYCAGDQGKYWEYRHEAFANQPPETEPPGRADFVKWATTVGLDLAKFTNCFDTQRYQSRVGQTTTEAQQAGVEGTPTFLINGTMYPGVHPFTDFKNALDLALATGDTP